MFTIQDILNIAIKMEENGEKIYRKAITVSEDPDIVSLLEWMAVEEAGHKIWFQQLKQDALMNEERSIINQTELDMLQDMIGDRSLSLDDVDFSKLINTNELCRTFIEFEKDTILFYEILTSFINDASTITGLKKIIEEENCHINQMKERLQT